MNTPEYKTLDQNYSNYLDKCLQIGPKAIAVYLKPSGILPDKVYHFLNNPTHDEDEKAEKLLTAIQAQVKVDPKSLNTFIKALESIESSHHSVHNSSWKWWIAAAVVLALVLIIALALIIWTVSNVIFKGPVHRFAEEIRSKYANLEPTNPYQNLLNNIKYEGVEFQLPFIIPKLQNENASEPTFDEVMNMIQPGSRVLFNGRPGAGKSTLTKYMALKWAEGELLTYCDLAILIPLMSTIPNLQALLNKALSSYSDLEQVERDINHSQGRGVCFILDALDEYTPAKRGKDDLVDSLLKREVLQQATVLVTSRMCARVNELKKAFKIRYNVIGFIEHDIFKYINKLQSKKLQEEILTVFEVNYNVKAMCYLPLHMTMIVHLATVDIEKLSATDTETVLYTDFLILTMQHYKERTEWSTEMIENCVRDPSTSTELCCQLKNIGKLAQVALLENSNTLNSTLLNQSQIETLEQISLFGLEIEHGRHYDVYYYTFAHPTFQEYLAAFYISQLPEDLAIEALKQNFGTGRYRLVWLFYAGIMGHYRNIDHKIFLTGLAKLYNTSRNEYFPLHQCRIDLEYKYDKFFMQLAYEAKATSNLQMFLNMIGYECDYDYTLTYYMDDTFDCLYLSYLLNYVNVRSLEVTFGLFENIADSCQTVFLKEWKLHNQSTQIVKITVNKRSYARIPFIIVPIIESALNLTYLDLNCGARWFHRLNPQDIEFYFTAFPTATVEKLLPKLLRKFSTKLEALTIWCPITMSVEALSELILPLINLRTLSVALLKNISDKGVARFAQSLSTMQMLTDLDLAFVRETKGTPIDTDTFSLFTIGTNKNKVPQYASLELGASITKLKHLTHLLICCDTLEDTEDYCASILSTTAVNQLTELRMLTLYFHFFKMSDALQLKASLPGLKQLTHLTLIDCAYEGEALRIMTAGLNQIRSLTVDQWCLICDRLFYETIYSVQSVQLNLEPTDMYRYTFSYLEPGYYLSLTHLAGALTNLNRLQHLEINAEFIDQQQAFDIYTAVIGWCPSSPHLAINDSRTEDSSVVWKVHRRKVV